MHANGNAAACVLMAMSLWPSEDVGPVALAASQILDPFQAYSVNP